MGELKLKPISGDDHLIELLQQAASLVFETTFNLKVSLEDFRAKPSPISTGDLSAVVGLVQQQHEGNLILSFPGETLFVALEKIYGVKFDEINKSVIEAAGEITNMVYGQFKSLMNEKGYHLQMALPTIVECKDHKILQISQEQGYFLSFLLGGTHPFSMTISLIGVKNGN